MCYWGIHFLWLCKAWGPALCFDLSMGGAFRKHWCEHSNCFAFPSGIDAPTTWAASLVRVKGIGRVERQLTADGFFNPSQPLTVTLKAEALYGTYTAFVDEILPAGVTVTNPGQGGVIEGNHLFITFDPTATSKTVTYTLQPAEGSRFLLLDGCATAACL
jgi:hypothetical protein